MPFNSPSDVPDNVPVKYRPQFAEVWNSVYAAAIADKKSPAQAEESAFAQAHGVINKQKAKDERDVSSDGPGFGPVRDGQPGGQVADPEMTLRMRRVAALMLGEEWRFAEDQLRGPDGKFASNAGENAHTTEEHLKAQSEHIGKAREALKAGDHDTAKAHGDAAAAHSKAAFTGKEDQEAVGDVARVASKVANDKSGIKKAVTSDGHNRRIL